MGHTFSRMVAHVAFSTKGRRPWLDADMRTKLLAYIKGIARQKDIDILALNAVEDHAHVLITLTPSQKASEIVQALKGNTSKWIHETYPDLHEFAWQRGYGIFSVSASNVAAVERYIAEQEAHHYRISWAEEYRIFLEKHGIVFDPEHFLD